MVRGQPKEFAAAQTADDVPSHFDRGDEHTEGFFGFDFLHLGRVFGLRQVRRPAARQDLPPRRWTGGSGTNRGAREKDDDECHHDERRQQSKFRP
ncbi:MAG TPA: hypothetical protein VGI17_04755 [Solirubrobacterales bacterium]